MSSRHRPTGGPACRNAAGCAAYDPATRAPEAAEPGTPLGTACLTTTEQAVRSLLYQWLDLEQMQAPTLSQSLTGQPGARPDPAMPLKGGVEALQAEILWVLTTWERVIRSGQRLAPPPVAAVRPGVAVQRAVGVLAVHIRHLAALPPARGRPAGCEDAPVDLDGVDACHHLIALHHRARAMLGRTRRVFWVPGDCWQAACAAAHAAAVAQGHPYGEWLWRSEPARERDEPLVHCRYCAQPRTFGDYQRYVRMLVWPGLHADGEAAA